MATLTTTRNYDDGQVLVRADLDVFLDDIETFLNVTKISDDNIQNSGITASLKLLNASITSNKMGASSVLTAAIADSNVTTAKIADDAVTNAKVADDAVNTAQIVDLAVTTAKINDAAVTTGKIANDGVHTVNILDSNVTTAKINDSAVTTAKINDGAVTPAKHSTNYVNDTLSGSRNTAGTTYVQGTSYTAGSRPIMIVIYSGAAQVNASGSTGSVKLSRYNGSTHTAIKTILSLSGASSNNFSWPTNDPIVMIDIPGAGSYQYEFELTTTGSALASVTNAVVLVYEL